MKTEVNYAKSFCLCHGDFHPDNLVMDQNQMYIIDWQNIHIGKSEGDISFFASRAEGFGIKTNKKELIAYYAKRLSKYTGEEVSYSQLLYEDSASTLFTTFMFWAYYLEDAPYERVALFFHSMVESYQSIIKK